MFVVFCRVKTHVFQLGGACRHTFTVPDHFNNDYGGKGIYNIYRKDFLISALQKLMGSFLNCVPCHVDCLKCTDILNTSMYKMPLMAVHLQKENGENYQLVVTGALTCIVYRGIFLTLSLLFTLAETGPPFVIKPFLDRSISLFRTIESSVAIDHVQWISFAYWTSVCT